MPEPEASVPDSTQAKRRNTRGIVLIWLVGTIVGIFVVVNLHNWLPNLLPPVASQAARDVNLTLGFFTVLAVPVAMLVIAVMAYTIFKSRSREFPEEEGPAIRGNNMVQGTWLVVSSLLCLTLVIWGLVLLPGVYTAGAGKNLVVNVTGNQWQWTYTYPDNGNVTSTTLELPVNTSVTFNVTSVDVSHSFWVPALAVKIDANNGQVTNAYVTPDRIGSYRVQCAELCGIYHAYMQGPANVVSAADFASWISSQQRSA